MMLCVFVWVSECVGLSVINISYHNTQTDFYFFGKTYMLHIYCNVNQAYILLCRSHILTISYCTFKLCSFFGNKVTYLYDLQVKMCFLSDKENIFVGCLPIMEILNVLCIR